ncbi:MAG: radical SAM protein, partial [Tannerellaceae bacterium]|nr:radical SAM protein [Tannerellaceae bacterium]
MTDSMEEINYIEAKTILSPLRKGDSWFGIGYNMNLYRGCQHGCIYCDTRSKCYRIGDISRIAVKKNAMALLEKELTVKRKKKATIGTGSMNDPYMPVEKDLQLVRNALEIISRFRFPVHVITKSSLIERDCDILQDISQTYAAVSFTITTTDNELAAKIEPGASLPAERLRAMEKLADKGIYTGVTLMPLLPFINDTTDNLESIIRQAVDAGASYILPAFGMTLREGSRDYYYQSLERLFPGLKMKYEHLFKSEYICNSPFSKDLLECFETLKSELHFS